MGGRGRSCQGRQVGRSHSILAAVQGAGGRILQRLRVNSGHVAIYGILMTVILCPFYAGAVMMPEHSVLCMLQRRGGGGGVNYFTHVSGFLSY